jgi:hypothetical protein
MKFRVTKTVDVPEVRVVDESELDQYDLRVWDIQPADAEPVLPVIMYVTAWKEMPYWDESGSKWMLTRVPHTAVGLKLGCGGGYILPLSK